MEYMPLIGPDFYNDGVDCTDLKEGEIETVDIDIFSLEYIYSVCLKLEDSLGLEFEE
jgi:hypothetical protein